MLTKFLTVSLFAVAVAASAVPPALTISKPNHCKKPFCISFCADATPFNCCVQYIRDPCSDHQKPPVNPPTKPCTGPNDFDCKCRCEKSPEITYFCNAQYFRDPCEPLDGEVNVSAV
ncbi:uncharacterized protein RSE6_03370 [Rhynchosporium secalis]|uniref:Uncharacterized protein n=1 Tax=Rhynchosporium secalis TaxID=38038 RepID=A0A1E1M431_RHYSE|nr:uncharacterized protein RSE6_03370 [Rhynchosporium secalis]